MKNSNNTQRIITENNEGFRKYIFHFCELSQGLRATDAF